MDLILTKKPKHKLYQKESINKYGLTVYSEHLLNVSSSSSSFSSSSYSHFVWGRTRSTMTYGDTPPCSTVAYFISIQSLLFIILHFVQPSSLVLLSFSSPVLSFPSPSFQRSTFFIGLSLRFSPLSLSPISYYCPA